MKTTSALLITTLFLLQTGCGGGLTNLAETILYPIKSVNKDPVPDVPPAGFEEVWFDVKASDDTDMKIHAWYHKTQNANANVIVYHHGNGMHLGRLHTSNLLNVMTKLNSHLVVYDFPAYGKSTGFPNEANLVASGQAALNFARAKFPRSPLIIWGRSMGAAVAARVVKNNPRLVSAMILTSPWSNFYDLAVSKTSLAKQLPKEWVEAHKYDSVDAVSDLNHVTLIHHGNADETIPIHFGKLVRDAFPANTPVQFNELDGVGHNDIFNVPQYWQDIKNFVR